MCCCHKLAYLFDYCSTSLFLILGKFGSDKRSDFFSGAVVGRRDSFEYLFLWLT